MAFVLGGVLLLLFAAMRYLRVAEDIPHNHVRWDPRLGVLQTGLLVLAGILLTVFLPLTG